MADRWLRVPAAEETTQALRRPVRAQDSELQLSLSKLNPSTVWEFLRKPGRAAFRSILDIPGEDNLAPRRQPNGHAAPGGVTFRFLLLRLCQAMILRNCLFSADLAKRDRR
jgi:hypothetical protein